LYVAETWKLRKVDQRYLQSSEMEKDGDQLNRSSESEEVMNGYKSMKTFFKNYNK
jgi:hypothetical protein